MDKVKITEMPKLVKKAQAEVTVGHMKKLLGSEKLGIVGGLIQGAYCAIRGTRRN